MYDSWSAGYVIGLCIAFVVMTQLFAWGLPKRKRRGRG